MFWWHPWKYILLLELKWQNRYLLSFSMQRNRFSCVASRHSLITCSGFSQELYCGTLPEFLLLMLLKIIVKYMHKLSTSTLTKSLSFSGSTASLNKGCDICPVRGVFEDWIRYYLWRYFTNYKSALPTWWVFFNDYIQELVSRVKHTSCYFPALQFSYSWVTSGSWNYFSIQLSKMQFSLCFLLYLLFL